jgi:predicted phosphodiesterase
MKVSCGLVLLMLCVSCSQIANAAQWDFNGDLASTTGEASLTVEAALPATAPGVTFSTTTINGQTAQVAHFTRGTFFRMTHGLAANGGGNYVNQYTLLLDILFPSRPTGWAALWQTSADNRNDADWFINGSGGLGISGVYGGTLANGIWNRVALVVDGVAGTLTSYLNGTQVQQLTGVAPDGRWSLDAAALLFADEDQENAGGSVNSVQLRPTVMNAADIASLGGPTAEGIPLPQVPSALKVLAPSGGEVFQAGTTQTVVWAVTDASGFAQLDLLVGDLVYRSLGQVQLRQTNFTWVIDPQLGDTNTYRIRITAIDFPTVQATSSAAFSVTGSGGLPNINFGQPLQLNGGFESGLTHWQTLTGGPITLTAAGGKGEPHTGSRFFHGGRGPASDAVVRQDIDLLTLGFRNSELDGGAAVEAEAWIRNAQAASTFDDQVYYRVGYLGETNQPLGGICSLIAGNGAWVKRAVLGALPPGTRKLRLEVVAQHRRDADNDSMADDISVRVQRAWPLVTPQITKLPLLQDVRADAMTLFWETDGNLAVHAVNWGRASHEENTEVRIETVQIDNTHFVHRTTLTGLSAETSYRYRVRSGTNASPTYTFRTAPRHDTPFTVAWWADSQVGPTVLQQLIPSMLAHGVDWMGVAGDLVTSGASLSDWNNYWFKALEFRNIGQTKPALFARGNHDGEHPFCYAYSTLPGNGSWYAFDYGNSRFIFLDSEASTDIAPEQYAWLTNELNRVETQQAAFRVVCFHKLPYANLWNGGGYTGEPWVRQDWVPLLRKHHVDMVINGHAHNYNRGVTNGVTYIVTGGGGGALDTERVAYWPLFTVEYSRHHYCLMKIDGNTLSWKVYDTTDQLLDTFTLKSRVPRLSWRGPAGGDTLALELAGKPGLTYTLQSSSGLSNWSDLSTTTLSLGDSAVITNLISTDHPQRFFRARIEP